MGDRMASAQSLSLLPRTMYSGAYCRSSSTMLCLLISPPWRMASAVFRCSVTSGRSRPWVSERMASFIGFPSPSDDDALAVVDLVLDNLGRPAGEGLNPLLEFFVLPADLDGLPPPGSAGAGEGQAPLLRLIGAGPFHDLRIEHDHIAALVVEGDDALVHADHVGRHTYAAVPVDFQCLQQIRRDRQVLRRGGLGLLGQKCLVFADVPNHDGSSLCR